MLEIQFCMVQGTNPDSSHPNPLTRFPRALDNSAKIVQCPLSSSFISICRQYMWLLIAEYTSQANTEFRKYLTVKSKRLQFVADIVLKPIPFGSGNGSGFTKLRPRKRWHRVRPQRFASDAICGFFAARTPDTFLVGETRYYVTNQFMHAEEIATRNSRELCFTWISSRARQFRFTTKLFIRFIKGN